MASLSWQAGAPALQYQFPAALALMLWLIILILLSSDLAKAVL